MPTQNLNNLKGRIAEQIIQDLFIQNNYNVFNYGIERVMPGIGKYLQGRGNSPTAKALRYMPDFVVQHRKNGDLFYLEVKFRASGYFSLKEVGLDYPYEKAWFVIVSPQKIQCLYHKTLAKGRIIAPDTNYKLEKIRAFDLDPQLITEYEQYARQVFMAFA